MDQSSIIFRQVVERNWPEVKPQKGRLVEYLLDHKFEPRTIELIAKHFVLNSVTISSVELYGEFCLLGTLQTKEGKEWVRRGYFPVGSCPNGDFVLLDIGKEFGSVLYVCHETCFDAEDPDSSIVVASSMGEFASKLEQRNIGSDFFQECWRLRTVTLEKDEPGGADIAD